MPGRSVTVASACPRTWPSLRSTVTPGKLPTCWLEPVSWLKRVVFPQFWLPARAKARGRPSGTGEPERLGERPFSPRAGWALGAWRTGSAATPSASWTPLTSMRAASARRKVSS